MRQIYGFVIGNCRINRICVITDSDVAVDMDTYFIVFGSVFVDAFDTKIRIDDFEVWVAEIIFIAVDKTKIPAVYRMGFDAVAAEKRKLHSIVIDIQMSLACQNPVAAVIEEVINVKF